MRLSKLIHQVKHLPPAPPKKKLGAGSAFALVAKPVAKVVDTLTGGATQLETCIPCVGPGGRQERWDAAIPDITKAPQQVLELLAEETRHIFSKRKKN